MLPRRAPATDRRSFRHRFAALVVLVALASIACGAAGTSSSALRGQRIEVLAVWSGVEQARFEQVIRAFEQATGAEVTYTSAGHAVPDVLSGRLAAANPPDVAFLPQPGLLRQYAAGHVIVPLDAATATLVDHSYAPVWRRLASVDGTLYGVWFKAANKSLVWYNLDVFERAGVVPPSDVDHLLAVARRVAASGVAPFAVAAHDGWTLVDLFANLYLRVAGPEQYDRLAEHQLAWTDPSVLRTVALLGRLLAPELVAGGIPAALDTAFEPSVTAAFATPPAAAMVMEGDFVGGLLDGQRAASSTSSTTSTTNSTTGTTGTTGDMIDVHADVFPFPSVDGSPPTVVAGGDVAVLMRPSSAGAAFVRFLATPEAAAAWARAGGFVSPNLELDLTTYPDPITRSMARSLVEAGDDVRFGIGDLQPASFGGRESSGLRAELRRFLVERDATATATRLEEAAQAAFGP